MKGYVLLSEFPNKWGEYSGLCVNQSLFTSDVYTTREEAEKWLNTFQQAATNYPVDGGVMKLTIKEVNIR